MWSLANVQSNYRRHNEQKWLQISKLQVDLDEIADEIEHSDPMMQLNSFLNLEAGEVVTIGEEENRLVENLYREYADLDSEEPLDLAAILAESNYPDWQRKMIFLADQVEAEFGKRFIRLPEQDSHAAYQDMVAFIPTVADQRSKSGYSVRLRVRMAPTALVFCEFGQAKLTSKLLP